ncbi:B-cell lymphoma/leukemia 10 isoform X3 [Clinocottus analis]|uniref:B-cell lymphoma/leukemia 10 isoform X3 n=1 Tax=Clinocottus analis TaxID=304258 RepID=UPI0035C2051E
MDVPQLTEEEMAEIKKDVLTRMRHYLCEKIRAERHLDYLRSRRILTRDDAEEIGCRTTQTKRTAMLLDMLAENPRGLDALIDSIRELRSQNFIITKITDEVQRAKNEKMESLKDGERSPSSSDVAGSLNLLSLQKGEDLPSGFASSATSSILPRPGDPGAPPLPEEVMVESPSNIDAGAPGCTSSGGDPNFQPLRSRSLTPTSHRSIL